MGGAARPALSLMELGPASPSGGRGDWEDVLGKVPGSPGLWVAETGGSCCSHQVPVCGCAWSVKNVSLGKRLPTVSCQWVCPQPGGGQTWAVFLGLVLASVCTSLSQCPQWGCCEVTHGRHFPQGLGLPVLAKWDG